MNLKLTHTVFKNEDIEKYLTEEEKMQLHNIDIRISHRRYLEDKKSNRYIICNTDEPYAEDVLSILQYTEKTGKKYGCIEILSKEQKESREYLRNYSTDDNYFDEEYS